MNKLFPIVLALLLFNCGTESSLIDSGDQNIEVCLSIDSGELQYDSLSDIYGFQFNHNGCGSNAVGGSDSVLAGFTVTANSDLVLGFSVLGSYIPAGNGVLIENLSCDTIDSIIISGSGGIQLSSEISNECTN